MFFLYLNKNERFIITKEKLTLTTSNDQEENKLIRPKRILFKKHSSLNFYDESIKINTI
jgi:hypothetical protein